MATFDLILRAGTVVTPEGPQVADLAVAGGRIAAIGPNLSGTFVEEWSAEGCVVLPGMIDAHVHFNEPGRTDWEGFATGSDAAAAGGVTTVFDMPLNSSPSTLNPERFREKAALAAAKSRVKVGLWGGLTPTNLDHLEALHACGVVGFKAFMSASGIDDFPRSDLDTLEKGMTQIARLPGMRLAVHAEDEALTAQLAAEEAAARRDGVAAFLASRPIEAEVRAIRDALAVAAATGCPLHVVHVSSAEGLALIAAARGAGQDVTAETCPHYLTLTEADLAALGAVAKCAPPLRSAADQTALWDALLRGEVDTIGSDHSPCPPSLKSGPFEAAWGGISGVEHSLPLLLTGLAARLEEPLALAAALTATRPAALFGRAGEAGSLVVGLAADLCLLRPREWTITRESLRHRHRQSPYLGRVPQWKVVSTWVDGRCVFAEP